MASISWNRMARRFGGSVVVLEPLQARHERGLFEAVKDPGIWRWLTQDASGSRGDFRAWFEEALAASRAGAKCAFAALAEANLRRRLRRT